MPLLSFAEGLEQGEPFGLGEAGEGDGLRLKTETGAALSRPRAQLPKPAPAAAAAAPVAYRIEEILRQGIVRRTKLHELIRTGELPARKIGA